MTKKLSCKNEEGFTLIEIIAVIIIMGILAAVAVPKFFSMQEDAKKAALNGALSEAAARFNHAYARFILDEKRLTEIDVAAIRQQIRQQTKEQRDAASGTILLNNSPLMDAATTLLRVDADGKRYQVSYYALEQDAAQYPGIDGLQRLLADIDRGAVDQIQE